ncbi:hypothetical protein [Hydrogenophaga sp.]|uniref:hypothetical protein n=1 Tax=Hydrogenophaga sp. TaxID=1904254 RepID=UPI003D2AF5DE
MSRTPGPSCQPVRLEHAGHLAVRAHQVAQVDVALGTGLNGGGIGRDDGTNVGFQQEGLGARRKRGRVVEDLRRHVARIARGAKFGNVRFQHGTKRGPGLRQRHIEHLSLVGSHDARAARWCEHRHAFGLGRRGLGKEARGLQQVFVLVHHHKARTLEQGVVTRRGTRECAGV